MTMFLFYSFHATISNSLRCFHSYSLLMTDESKQSLYIKASVSTVQYLRSKLCPIECYTETNAARKMSSNTIVLLFLATVITLSVAGGGGGYDRVIIHVPYHIKTIKHTHTITKYIHNKDDGGGDRYEILGYTYGHPIDLGGHERGLEGAWADDFGGHEVGTDIGGGHERYYVN